MSLLECAELLSYVVTIVGLPLAIGAFMLDQRKERMNEEEEMFQRLSDEYVDFLELVLNNSDLHLLKRQPTAPPLTDEQKERKFALFGILVSIFERAYIMVYEDDMDKHTKRLWSSWDDYMREWVRREDFRQVMPELLEGEDEDFQAYIRRLAADELEKKKTS